jgi:hypothetical protein
LCVGGSQVHEPGRRRSGLANVARWLASRNSCGPGLRPAAWDAARDRTQNRCGESSRGEEAQESTDSPVPPWPGLRNRNGNGLPGGAKLRSGRAGHSHGEPRVVGTGSSSRHAHGRVEAAVLAIARIRCPGSCVQRPPPGGRPGKELAQWRKRPRNSRWLCAGGEPEAIPAREQEACESRYGSSGRESSVGQFQGRERHGIRPRNVGGHGERRVPQGIRACRERESLNRREGQEP